MAAAIAKDNSILETQPQKQATESEIFQVQNLLGGKGMCEDVIYSTYTFIVAKLTRNKVQKHPVRLQGTC